MAIPRAVLDTDVLSAILRRDPVAIPKARAYLAEHRRLTFSLITRYEILRGLKAKAAEKQLGAFKRLCARSEIVILDDRSVVKAAEIYADLYRRGELIGDADILIAASALVNDFHVATGNEGHF